MSTELLDKFLSLKNEDEIFSQIDVIEDKETVLQLYKDTKAELEAKFNLFQNKEVSLFGKIKNFFVKDELSMLYILCYTLNCSADRMYNLIYDEMVERLDELLSHRTNASEQTIKRFLDSVNEIENVKNIKIADLKKCVDFLSDTDKQVKVVQNMIESIPGYQKIDNYHGFEELDQKIQEKTSGGFIKGGIEGAKLVGGAISMCAGNAAGGVTFAHSLNKILNADNQENREIITAYVNKSFEYCQLLENTSNEFRKIIDTTHNLINEIKNALEKTLPLFENFEPLVADFDNQDKYCNQVFNDLSEQINKIYELLIQKI